MSIKEELENVVPARPFEIDLELFANPSRMR